MDFLNCYICNVQTKLPESYRMRTKTKYSGTSVYEIVQNFLKSTHLLRYSANDVICEQCYRKLNQYDLACRMSSEIQQEITNALYATEQEYLNEDETVEYLEDPTIDDASACQADFDELQTMYDEDLKSSRIKEKEAVFISADSDIEPQYISEIVTENDSSGEIGSPKKRHIACQHCDNVFFSTKKDLRTHHLRNHIKKKCGICQTEFPNQIELHAHRRRDHEVSIEGETDDNDSVDESPSIKVVVGDKGQGTMYRCDICGIFEDTKESLESHTALHENRLQCVVCGVVLKHKGNLVLHMRIHTNKKFFKCDKCNKEFCHKSSLRMHLQTTHNNVRNKQCPECPLKFKTTSQLNQHLVTHSGIKKWKCPECGKAFGQKYNMTAHFKSHSSKKSIVYKCGICNIDFSVRKQLTMHTKRFHDAANGNESTIKIKTEMDSQ